MSADLRLSSSAFRNKTNLLNTRGTVKFVGISLCRQKPHGLLATGPGRHRVLVSVAPRDTTPGVLSGQAPLHIAEQQLPDHDISALPLLF